MCYNDNGIISGVFYIFKLHGLCGNYNDDKSDDLETSAGTITKNFIEFAQSYQVEKCSNDVASITCTDQDKHKWSVANFCVNINQQRYFLPILAIGLFIST